MGRNQNVRRYREERGDQKRDGQEEVGVVCLPETVLLVAEIFHPLLPSSPEIRHRDARTPDSATLARKAYEIGGFPEIAVALA